MVMLCVPVHATICNYPTSPAAIPFCVCRLPLLDEILPIPVVMDPHAKLHEALIEVIPLNALLLI